jgi:hypothetical protein
MIILSLVAVTALGAMAASAYGAGEWLLKGAVIVTADFSRKFRLARAGRHRERHRTRNMQRYLHRYHRSGATGTVTEFLSLANTPPPLDRSASGCSGG